MVRREGARDDRYDDEGAQADQGASYRVPPPPPAGAPPRRAVPAVIGRGRLLASGSPELLPLIRLLPLVRPLTLIGLLARLVERPRWLLGHDVLPARCQKGALSQLHDASPAATVHAGVDLTYLRNRAVSSIKPPPDASRSERDLDDGHPRNGTRFVHGGQRLAGVLQPDHAADRQVGPRRAVRDHGHHGRVVAASHAVRAVDLQLPPDDQVHRNRRRNRPRRAAGPGSRPPRGSPLARRRTPAR